MSISQEAGVVAAPVLPNTPTQLFVAGTWRDAADGTTFDDISPTSEQVLAQVAAAAADDVDDAVVAARAQVDGGEWASMTGADRGRLLYRLADAMERDLEIFVDARGARRRQAGVRAAHGRHPATRSTRSATSPAGPTRSRAAG